MTSWIINSLHAWSKQKSQQNWSHIFIALLVAGQERNTGEQQTNALLIKKLSMKRIPLEKIYTTHTGTISNRSNDFNAWEIQNTRERTVRVFCASQSRFLWQLHMRSLSFFLLVTVWLDNIIYCYIETQ